MLAKTGAVLLKEDEVGQDQLMCHYRASLETAFGPVDFKVYRQRRIRLLNESDKALADAYADFRKCLFEERRRQRRRQWN